MDWIMPTIDKFQLEQMNIGLKDVDKARDNYRKKYCKDMAGVFDNRDICIDSSKFGAEATAKILCGIARSVFK